MSDLPVSAPTQERSPTGVPGLDAILHGGLLPNRLYLLDGNPGSGKTTLALQYLLEGLRVGQRCLYVTLSETREELEAGAASHGLSLAGIDIVELIADEDELSGDGELTMYQTAEVELIETMRRVLDAVRAHNPDRMAFDSLSELRLLAQSSLRYRRQIFALKRFFTRRKCTVLLLDDRTAEGPDMQLQSIAHGVISLDHSAPAYGRALRQLQIVKFRGSDFSSGYHDFRIVPGGLTLFPRLTAAHHPGTFPLSPVQSGIPGLDSLLGGGVRRGTTTLLIGPPGTGKSSLGVQYAAAAAARGEHAAIFAFEESRVVLLSRSAGLGMTITEGEGAGQVMIRQIDPTEIAPGEFAHMVRDAVERRGARVIVIDSLNGYLNAMPEERVLGAQLHELTAYLGNQGVATFLVAAQAGVLGTNMRAPVDASYLADAVVMLRMYEHRGTVKKAVSVLKNRSGAHEETIRRIWFDGEGIHLSEPLSRLRGIFSGVPVENDAPTDEPVQLKLGNAD